MVKNIKKIGLLFLILTHVFFANSQDDYTDAIGLRGGFYNGITYKTFLNDEMAFEGMLTTRYEGVHFTALIEFYNPLFYVRTLYWYYGVGSHIGFYDQTLANIDEDFMLGIDGVLGVEYTFESYPINISLDWKPMFNLFGVRPIYDSGALSVRYCFSR